MSPRHRPVRVLTPVFRANPSLFAGWTAVKRVRRTVVTPLPGGSTPPDTTVGGTTPPADPAPPVAPDQLAA